MFLLLDKFWKIQKFWMKKGRDNLQIRLLYHFFWNLKKHWLIQNILYMFNISRFFLKGLFLSSFRKLYFPENVKNIEKKSSFTTAAFICESDFTSFEHNARVFVGVWKMWIFRNSLHNIFIIWDIKIFHLFLN